MAKNVATICLMALALTSCDQGRTSQEQQNIRVAERLFGEVWSDGDVEILDEIIRDDYVKHWASFDPVIGRDQLKQEVQDLRQTILNSRIEVNAIEASDDMVFVRYTLTGTSPNDSEGMQANRNAVNIAGMGWLRFENGQIVEEWMINDEWGAQIQLEIDIPKEWLNAGWD